MRIRSSIVAAMSLALVGSCGGVTTLPIPFSTVPLANVVAFPDGQTYELTGDLVIHTNRSSSFTVASQDGDIACKGSADSTGNGAVVCNGGLTILIRIPKEKFGKFNGSYVDQQPDFRVATGWGKEADLAMLKGLLAL